MIDQIFEAFKGFLSHYTYEQWERFIIWCLATGLIYWNVHFKHRKDIFIGFKGENGLLEIPEGIVYAWFWAWPFMLTTSYFFQWPIEAQIWSFLEIILYVALGIRGAMETAKILKAKPEEIKKEEPPKTP